MSAMRLLWPERAEEELSRLPQRGAFVDAAYLRTMLLFWTTPVTERRSAERTILASARRACSLASNDAEEAIDRVMQEPHFGRNPPKEHSAVEQALIFATYLRRLTQSVTTLALLGSDAPARHQRLDCVVERLERIARDFPPAVAPSR